MNKLALKTTMPGRCSGQSISQQRQWLIRWSADNPEVRIKRRSIQSGIFEKDDQYTVISHPDYFRDITRILWLPPTHGVAFVVAAGAYVTVWQQSRLSESGAQQGLETDSDSTDVVREDVAFRIRCLLPRIRGRVVDIAISPVDLDANLQLAVCTLHNSIYIYDCLDQFNLKVWDLQEEIWCSGCRSVCWGPLNLPCILVTGLSSASTSLIKLYEKKANWGEIDISRWADVHCEQRIGDVTAVAFSSDISRTDLILALIQQESLQPEFISMGLDSSKRTGVSNGVSASEWIGKRIEVLQDGSSQSDTPIGEIPVPKLAWDSAGVSLCLTLSLAGFDMIRIWKMKKSLKERCWECVHAQLLAMTDA